MGRLFGHSFVILWSLFRELWDMLGDVWAYFGHVFGWVWDGFGKKSEHVKTMKFSNLYGSICPALGCSKQAFLTNPSAKIQ